MSQTEPLSLRHALLSAGFLALTLSSCQAPPDETLIVFSGDVMGTRFNVRALAAGLDPATRGALERRVMEELSAVDDSMTTYRDSEVTRFNQSPADEPFEVSAPLAEVVRLALELANETGGALDITVGPLVDAYGFGAGDRSASLSPDAIETLQARIGYEHLSVDAEGRLTKHLPGIRIDLSAVAKGYGVDRAAAALDRFGVSGYMVEVGGEVRAKGVNERGESWRIGIEQPDIETRRPQRIVPLADMALATSGDYRNYREVDGRRISHLIDPRSGVPIAHRVASATVLHPECAVADGLATAMMVLGEGGLDLAEAKGWAVLLLVRAEDGEDGFVELETSAFRRLVESAQSEST